MNTTLSGILSGGEIYHYLSLSDRHPPPLLSSAVDQSLGHVVPVRKTQGERISPAHAVETDMLASENMSVKKLWRIVHPASCLLAFSSPLTVKLPLLYNVLYLSQALLLTQYLSLFPTPALAVGGSDGVGV